ncbi:hypothetical protein EI42_06356 [Thermosporothrix hazakensis]|uniref:Uncharacterized protein n=1 Tax=Thermosporothrix hazakensis TaxID=644383 RepID=A0A326TNR0_THEHA|nr:hypothetical protein EI42_06356 [Thermosporothrix hazakensis]
MLLGEAFENDMLGVLLQSFSSRDRHQATRCRTSAFLLQTLSQSCAMVGFGPDPLARMEGACARVGTAHCRRANACIHPDHLLYALRCGISDLDGKRNQQIELLVARSYHSFAVPIVAPCWIKARWE